MRIIIPVLVLLLAAFVLAGIIYLRSDSFQRVARNVLISRIQRATGLQCSLDHMELDVFHGKFILAGLTLLSDEREPSPFRFEVQEARGLLGLPFFKSGRELQELELLGPKIRIITEARGPGWEARSILPALKQAIEFAARKVTVHDGWLELNNRRIPLELSLNDLTCDIRYQDESQHYRIGLSYRNGRLAWLRRIFQYDLKTDILLSLEGLDFESIEISRHGSVLKGTGQMLNWDSPEFQFHISGTIMQEELPLFHPVLEDAEGRLDIDSRLRHDSDGFHSSGRFHVESGSYRKAELRNLEGIFELEKDVLKLSNVTGQIEGGRLSAEGTLFVRGSRESPHSLRVGITNIQMAQVARIFSRPKLAFQNTLDVETEISWHRGLQDLEAEGKVRLHKQLDTGGDEGEITDLAGEVGFRHTRGLWFIRDAELQSAHTHIETSPEELGASHLYLETARPSEILRLVRGFSPPLDRELDRRPDVLKISGSYRLDGDLLLQLPDRIGYRGSVEAHDERWGLLQFDTLSSRADWNGKTLTLNDLRLELGQQTVAGDLVLDYSKQAGETPNLSFTGRLDEISLAQLQSLGFPFDIDILGKVSGNGSAAYDQWGWRGAGEFRIEEGQINQYPFDLMGGEVELGNGRLRIAEGFVSKGAAKVRVRGEIYLDTREINLSTHLTELPLQDLSAIREKELPVQGTMTAIGRLYGTLDNPSFEGDFDLFGLRYSSWDFGQGSGILSLKDGLLTADADIQSDLGYFKGKGNISLDRGYPGSASLEFQDWNVKKIIEGDAPPYLKDLSTALQGNIRVEGNFAEPDGLYYQGEMDGAQLKIHDYDFRNEGRIRFSMANQRLQVREARFVGEGSDLSLSGEIPLDESGSLDLKLDGRLNLRLLDQFNVQSSVSGSADLDVRATGSLRDPRVIGRAHLVGTEVHYKDYPYALSNLQGNVVFSRNTISFENIEGDFASGLILITGSVEHENAEVRSLNLIASLKRARIYYPEDFRSIVDADLNLKGDNDSRVLLGEVRVIRSDYQREFNILEQLASRDSVPSGPRLTDPVLGSVSLDIMLNSDDGLYVENEFANLRGKMALSLRGTIAYPSLIGRVEVTEGYVSFRGNRFDLIQGSVDFVDRNRINPIFDVRAETDVKSYLLRLYISGGLDQLRFNVTSDPPLSTVDIVALLTTGIAGEGAEDRDRTQTEATGLSAASILTENLTGVIGRRVQRLFGLETFRVDPFLAGAENDPTARITISERLSKDMTLTFSRNLSTNEEQIVILEYEVGKNFTIVATRGEDGVFGIDFRFRKRFR